MNTISGLIGAGAISRGVGQVLAAARGANPSTVARSNPTSGPDTLEISREAEAQLASAGHLPGNLRLAEAQAKFDADLRDLEQRLVTLLKDADIEIGDGFELEASADGRTVVGSHPHQNEIQRLLADHADLRKLVQSLSDQAAAVFGNNSTAIDSRGTQLRLTMTTAGLEANPN